MPTTTREHEPHTQLPRPRASAPRPRPPRLGPEPNGAAIGAEQLRDQIALRLDLGWSLSEVNSTLIERATALSADERDALWLFAWSYPRSGGRAAEHVRATTAR